MAGQRCDDSADGHTVLHLRLERRHGISGTRQHAAVGRESGSGSEYCERTIERRYSLACGQWISERSSVYARSVLLLSQHASPSVRDRDPDRPGPVGKYLRGWLRRPGAQYLSWAVSAELGCVVPEALQDWGAAGHSLRG